MATDRTLPHDRISQPEFGERGLAHVNRPALDRGAARRAARGERVTTAVPASAADAVEAAASQAAPAPPAARGHFRPDIEGLRAVAVLAVLAYHVRLPGFAGGLIGVDVFYVISGFLITGLLRRELLSTGGINFVTFYARRARRLLPAALLVIAVTVVVSFFTLSRLRFPDVAGDAAAAALYVSNYRFVLNATDYLAAGTDPSPLLHYWSLGVEEQFYLFWPLLIFLGAALLSARRLALVIVPVAIVSLIACIMWTDIAAQWAFFSLPTRAWELALGALIEIGLLRLPARAGTRVATATGWLGLGLVLFAVAWITPDTPFPGTVAIIPVVGAGLLIMAGARSSATPSRWLATSVPRWFGQISYSLYLWHWPLLILVPIMIGRDDLPTRLLLAVAAVGIAALSTRYIEIPFREGRVLRMPPVRSLAMAGGASVLVAVGAVTLAGLPGLFQPSPASAQVPVRRPPWLAQRLRRVGRRPRPRPRPTRRRRRLRRRPRRPPRGPPDHREAGRRNPPTRAPVRRGCSRHPPCRPCPRCPHRSCQGRCRPVSGHPSCRPARTFRSATRTAAS